MNAVMQTIRDEASGNVALAQDFTFECHTPERLAEILSGTFAAMPPTARLTRVYVA